MQAPMPPTKTNSWLDSLRPPATPVRFSLVCIPYAGGSEQIYRPWLTLLPPEVELLVVQLPGRGRRFQQPNVFSIEQSASAIAAELPAKLQGRPWALFGHSMGAKIGFELLHLLPNLPVPVPQLVMLSGARAPFLAATQRQVDQHDRASFVSLLREMNGTPTEILQNEELLNLLLPMLQRDFAHVERYRSDRHRPVLQLPAVQIIGGTADPEVSPDQLDAWQHCFAPKPLIRQLSGDHFFLHQHAAWIVATLCQGLMMAGSKLPTSQPDSAMLVTD